MGPRDTETVTDDPNSYEAEEGLLVGITAIIAVVAASVMGIAELVRFIPHLLALILPLIATYFAFIRIGMAQGPATVIGLLVSGGAQLAFLLPLFMFLNAMIAAVFGALAGSLLADWIASNRED